MEQNSHQAAGDDGTSVSQALAVLNNSQNTKARRQAVEALGSSSQAVTEQQRTIVEALIETVLTDSDDRVRAEAINSLYFLGDEYVDELVTEIATLPQYSVPDVFSAWLTHAHSEFRMVGATAMSSFGKTVSSELEAALTDDDPRVQARSVRAYGAIGAESVEPIRPLLHTPNSHVRHTAVSTLTRIGTPEALSLLSSLTRANDHQLRRIAVKHLYQLDLHKSARLLLSALNDPSTVVQRTAMVSLIRLFSEGTSVQPGDVRDYLVSTQSFDHDELAELLHAIVLGDKRDHATQSTRRNAAWLLGELTDCVDDQLVVPWLISALQQSDSMVADLAAAYIPQLEATTVEKELQMLISDSDTSTAVTDRAQRVLDKLRQSTAEAVESHSIEYTYVRTPADYTEKHAQ